MQLRLYAIQIKGEGCGVKDFKGNEDNSQEDEKESMFAGPYRNNRT